MQDTQILRHQPWQSISAHTSLRARTVLGLFILVKGYVTAYEHHPVQFCAFIFVAQFGVEPHMGVMDRCLQTSGYIVYLFEMYLVSLSG